MGGINGANHLKVESIPGHHASHHPLCAPNALGYMWDREKFDRDVAEGVACLACVRTLELDALKRQMGHAAAAYKPNFIVSDHHWMELNQALMIDEFQVYTAVVMARREMEQVNIIGALEHLLVDCDKPYYSDNQTIQRMVLAYKEYKEELAFFNEAFAMR